MPTERNVAAQRALRLGCGTALCTAASYGLGLPLAFLSPVLAVLLLANLPRPLPLKAAVALTLAAAFTTSFGLLLVPLLRYYPVCGVLLIGIGLFVVFRFGLRGGNVLIMTLMMIGMTMISAAGFASFDLAMAVIGALLKGLLLAIIGVAISHALFPEPGNSPPPPSPAALPAEDVPRVALRATLIVLPTFLLVLIDPASYLPIVLKAVSLGQQSTTTRTYHAGRELLGSTLLGGVLAVLFWCALSLFVHLWMFALWMLLFSLFVARKLYRLHPTQLTPGFWLNTLVTMIILLGQSVEDSATGKDVYTAFAVRMGLFIAVTLYSGVMMHVLESHRPVAREVS